MSVIRQNIRQCWLCQESTQ